MKSPCPWGFPNKNTGVSYHFLLQRNFPTQESSLHLLRLLHLQADLRWTTQEAQKTQNQGILLLTVVSRRNSVTYLFFLKAHHFRGNWKCPPRPLLCLNCFLNLIKFNVSISKVFTNVKRFFWPLILSPLFDQEFCIFCKKETICPSVFCQVHVETWGFD